MRVNSFAQPPWVASAFCEEPGCSFVTLWIGGLTKGDAERAAAEVYQAHSTKEHPTPDNV